MNHRERIVQSALKLPLLAILMVSAYPLLHAAIDFRPLSLEQAMEAAKSEGKMVFLDGVTSTCPPCRRMEKQTFTDAAVADFFNARFVNIRIDLNKAFDGEAVQTRYNLHDFPSLLFVNAVGELLHIHVGFLDAKQFLEFGREVVAPDFMSLAALKEAYRAHPSDRHIAAQYIIQHAEAGQDISDAWPQFRRGMTGASLLQPDNWAVFQARIDKLSDAESAYFVGHFQDFQRQFGNEAAEKKYIALHQSAMRRAIGKSDSLAFFNARAGLLKLDNAAAKREVALQDLEWNLAQANWVKYFELLNGMIEDDPKVDAAFLDRAASTIGAGDSDPIRLHKALDWSKMACGREPSFDHLYTQFSLLDRLEEREEAIRVGKQVVELGKASGSPYGEVEDRIRVLEGK